MTFLFSFFVLKDQCCRHYSVATALVQLFNLFIFNLFTSNTFLKWKDISVYLAHINDSIVVQEILYKNVVNFFKNIIEYNVCSPRQDLNNFKFHLGNNLTLNWPNFNSTSAILRELNEDTNISAYRANPQSSYSTWYIMLIRAIWHQTFSKTVAFFIRFWNVAFIVN